MKGFSISGLNESALDDLADEFDRGSGGGSRHSGGGGGKHRKPDSETSNKARESALANSKEKRAEEAKHSILNDLKHFPKEEEPSQFLKRVESYKEWLLASVQVNEVQINFETDVEHVHSRASRPGGQNVNKVFSAVTAKHKFSGIFSKSDASRDMPENMKLANAQLLQRLEIHLKNWKTYFTDISMADMPKKIEELLNELH